MQCTTSYVILDPKGEIARDTGYLLEKEQIWNKSVGFNKYGKISLL